MPYTESELVQFVAAKIDEILPPGEAVPGDSIIESPVAFIQRELKESANDILRQAPILQVKRVIKKGTKHFPSANAVQNGLVFSGGTNTINNDLVSINGVTYILNGVTFTGNPMPVTIAGDPDAGFNRRDIVVGNSSGTLEYIAGTPNAIPGLLDFPLTPEGKILVKKVILLYNGVDGFDKTYTNPPTVAATTNPNIRVIPSLTPQAYVIPCPTDFLRFVDIRLSTWKATVSELIPQEDPRYIEQQNIKWTRGTELKPVGAMVSFTEYISAEIVSGIENTGLAIECFTSKTLPTIQAFRYVPQVAPTLMPDDLVDAMVYQCAGRVLLIMQQPEKAQLAFSRVASYYSNKFGVTGS
jgi:hypothetical protein